MPFNYMKRVIKNNVRQRMMIKNMHYTQKQIEITKIVDKILQK